jgi:hypothetical protein
MWSTSKHRHIDRHGESWQGVSEGVDGEGGWSLYLQRFAGLFGQED